jgi:hypothetical protein
MRERGEVILKGMMGPGADGGERPDHREAVRMDDRGAYVWEADVADPVVCIHSQSTATKARSPRNRRGR